MSEQRASHFDVIYCTSKAAISAVLAVLLFAITGWRGTIWAAISAVIVTELHIDPSLKAALTRVTANLIGAFTGAIVNVLIGHTLLSLAIGIVLTGIICHLARLDDALRPAYSAVVVVILTSDGDTGPWAGSRDRVVAVAIGCLCALAIGLIGDRIVMRLKLRKNESTTALGRD